MLMRVTGRVNCFGCVCVPSRFKDKVLCVLCVLVFMYYYIVCYFTRIFYAVVRQISLLFIDNKDSVFCIYPPEMEMNPPNTVCGYLCGGVLNTNNLNVKHAILSNYGMHLSMYSRTS